ncbi:MAG: P1 family peptidase, partial [Sulfolobales archaeon]
MTRVRDVLEIPYWKLRPGPRNSISDVEGVRVGHVTLIEGRGPLVPGRGPVRTGVTVVLPHSGNLYKEKVIAAAHVINGFTKAVGLIQVEELGLIETPIALTNTLNVG